jgi:pseudouridine synthase
MTTLRLVKAIAQAGVASRRGAGDLVKAGLVTVNGAVVTNPALAVDPAVDHVKVRGKHLPPVAAPVYVMLNKPVGYVTTRSDPEDRPTVMDLVRSVKAPVFPVGRLDMDTEGLLLLTNDGDLAQRLVHPRFGVRKVYRAKVKGSVAPATIEKLRHGFVLDDGPATPELVEVAARGTANTQVRIVVGEGRNRLIRRLLEAAGHPVAKLIRERFGPVELGDLKVGRFRYLTEIEISALRKGRPGV